LTFRGLLSNPQIMTFDNTTATGVSVNSGVLTFGGSLTPSNVQIDGVSVSNAQAGALINGGDFHTLSFDLATFNATDLRVGTDGSDFFPLAVHTLSLNNGTDSWRFQSETIEDVESTGVGPDAEPLAMFYATMPRDESEPEKDIAGGDLQYASRAPLPVAIRVPVLTFDGVDSYVDIDDGAIAAISPTGNYTFAMWINPASTSGVRHLISYPTDANSRHGMYIQNGVLKGGYRNSSTYFGAPAGNVSANQWQHVALVNNGGTLSMYVNGVATTGATSMSFLSAAERTIGGKSQYTSGYFSGPISDVRIYTESLSAADILDLYNGIEPDDTNLERHYPLQEGSGLTCYNTVANDSHGTLTDADVGVARATRSSGVQDYSVKFGCRPDSGASVPALRGGSVAANGGAITVPAPEVNPLALISRDPFDAAELNPIVDSPYLPAVDIEDEAPANTKFERKSSADGRDRLITTSAPLTGTDLFDIETYVGPLSLTDDTFLPDSFPLVD